MSDDTAISAARTALHAALVDAVVAPAWRIHRTAPAQLIAPCVYLDSAELGVGSVPGAGIVAVTFPVVAVADGKVEAQVAALDDILARIWTAAMSADGDPTGSRPVALDVGGPTLRAHAVRVEMFVAALTMCAPPNLVLTGGKS